MMRFQASTFVKDCYWDSAVDALLAAVRKYDGRIPFPKYFAWMARKKWSATAKRLNRRKRQGMFTETKLPRADITGRLDAGLDAVDARDFHTVRVPTLAPKRRESLERWLAGEREIEIAAGLGLSKQTVHARIRSGLNQLAAI